MQNKDNKSAQIPLKSLSSRFKLMPEFIFGWDWSGFRRGLSESISDDLIREQATSLVDAANCYIPQTTLERLEKIENVSNFLKAN